MFDGHPGTGSAIPMVRGLCYVLGEMGHLPVMLDLAGRSAIVVGGGAVAARKVAVLLRAGARVTVVTPEVSGELAEIASGSPEVDIQRRAYRDGDLSGAAIAFAATDSEEVQERVADEASRRGVWLNAVDDPERCSFLMPAILERGPIQVAVSTGGASPALARRVRDEIDAALGSEYGAAAEHLGALRERFARGEARAQAFARLLDEGLLEAFRQGDAARVARMTHAACAELSPRSSAERRGGR